MRKQIVHNLHVVRDLETRGAVFVDELDQVPEGATVVFSAHGVAPGVHAEASDRGLRVVDATCPLVTKVHQEARKFAAKGYDIVLIGHEGHEEVVGTMGHAPRAVHLVGDEEDAAEVDVADPERVAYLTQTTLSVDETAGVIDTLRERFPVLAGPRSDDICYATQNRQAAVKALARDCQLVLVIGAATPPTRSGWSRSPGPPAPGPPDLGRLGHRPGLVRGRRHRRRQLGRLRPSGWSTSWSRPSGSAARPRSARSRWSQDVHFALPGTLRRDAEAARSASRAPEPHGRPAGRRRLRRRRRAGRARCAAASTRRASPPPCWRRRRGRRAGPHRPGRRLPARPGLPGPADRLPRGQPRRSTTGVLELHPFYPGAMVRTGEGS